MHVICGYGGCSYRQTIYHDTSYFLHYRTRPTLFYRRRYPTVIMLPIAKTPKGNIGNPHIWFCGLFLFAPKPNACYDETTSSNISLRINFPLGGTVPNPVSWLQLSPRPQGPTVHSRFHVWIVLQSIFSHWCSNHTECIKSSGLR